MAEADAWGAPSGLFVGVRKGAQNRAGAQAGQKLLTRGLVKAEPQLRRAIPIMILAFLVMVAGAQALSLFAQYQETDRVERNHLTIAAKFIGEHIAPTQSGLSAAPKAWAEMRDEGMTSGQEVMLLLDSKHLPVLVEPTHPGWSGVSFDILADGGAELLTFGEDAGTVDLQIDGRGWLAAASETGNPGQLLVLMAPRSDVFGTWVASVKINIALFILTSGIMAGVLYAFLLQSGRVRAGEAMYDEAHQRIDLALVRGRCGLWDWDMARGRMFWSRSMYDMLGYQPTEAVLSFGDVDGLIHPADQDLYTLAQRIASRETDHIDHVFRMQHADGSWVWVRARAQVVDPNADELHLIGIALDVSEQHQLAIRSETADMRLSTAIECITESFVLWDASNRLVMCNDRFQKDLGLSNKDVQAGTSKQTIEERRLAYASERRLANPNGPRGGASFERQLSDGRWLQVTELKTPDGGTVSIGSDITQLKLHQDRLTESERRLIATIQDLQFARKAEAERTQQLEQETERAEGASRAKSEFLANMSHELRTPLNAVIGFSEIMANGHFGPLGNDRYVEYANDIHDSGEHLLGVINDILDMARIESGHFQVQREAIDLNPLIAETVRVVSVQAQKKQIEVATKFDPELRVFADRRALKQITINLLSNAVKFTEPGGKITVSARRVDGAFLLSIADNGCGIPKPALTKLGRPFEQVQNQFSRNHQGSGLGLAISRSLAEMHGGTLRIRSKEGAGTVVSVRIPLDEAAIRKAA